MEHSYNRLNVFNFEIGFKYYHVSLGQLGLFTKQCKILNDMNPDTTSAFLEFDGDIKEVSINLIRDFNI